MNIKVIEIRIDSNALKLTLRHYVDKLRGKRNLEFTLGIFVALAIPIFTCDFHDALGMKAAVIESAVCILCAVSFVFAVYFSYKRFTEKIVTPEELVDQIQEMSEKTTVSVSTTQI